MFTRKRKAQAEQPRKVWLHIGHGKTGTTALQKYFEHRATYDPSFYYPKTGRRETGAHHDVFPLEVQHALLKKAPAALRKLRKEIDKQPHDTITVLSSEHLCYFRGWQVKQVLETLDGYDVQVLYYVRRQDELIESTYKWLLVGARDEHGGIEAFSRTQPQAFDFLKRLEPWTKHIDRDRIHCRLYHRETCGGDIVSDVESVLGLAPLDESMAKSMQRESLDSLQVELLNAFDAAHPNSGARQQFLDTLRNSFAEHEVRSHKKAMPQDVRADVMERFRKTNTEFAEQFLSAQDGRILLSE